MFSYSSSKTNPYFQKFGVKDSKNRWRLKENYADQSDTGNFNANPVANNTTFSHQPCQVDMGP